MSLRLVRSVPSVPCLRHLLPSPWTNRLHAPRTPTAATTCARLSGSLERWTAQAAASERGLINALLGNTCFTTAIAALNQQCSQLNNEQRCWLALQFTTCFQRASGFKVLDCPAVCPRRRPLQSCVEECTSRMDDKAQITYTQFFGDVFK